MLSFLPKESQEIMEELRVKFKAWCKSMSYTQTECATRSGVSFGSLLKLAFVLECLGDFYGVCEDIDEILET